MDVKKQILWRIYLVMLLISLFACSIFMKAVKIQVIEGEKWRAKADSLYLDYRPVNAERGNIFASDGSLLATSLPMFELRMDTRATGMTDDIFYDNVDSLSRCLASLEGSPYTYGGYRDRLLKAKKNGERYMLIQKNVTYPELQEIKKFPLFRLGRYTGGLIVEKRSKRRKPFKMLAHRTIGYVRENAKSVGLEGAFNQLLAGEQGQRLMQRISGSTWIPVNDLTEIEPKNGQDIVTTIDVNIQDVTENALKKALIKHNAKHGCAVVMEVKTGKIRAIANIGKTEEGSLWENYNYAVGASTEPGSTFKLAAMMALLEDKLVRLEDSVDLFKGQMEFAGEMMEDATYHALERATVKKVFEISSNVGIASLVHQHYKKTGNAADFIQHLKDFRLHQMTGIEIEGEGEPYIKEAFQDDWSHITLPWMSTGYEVRVTPLQLLTFYNAVANNGRMMKPYLVEEVQEVGVPLQVFKPTVLKRSIASYRTIQQAKALLEAVVETGTAKHIKFDGFKVAGKTGTVITNYRTGMPDNQKKYQASFAGFFPADNPAYSCIVVINNPVEKGYYGATVAAPVFREIAGKCYATHTAAHQAINTIKKPNLIAQKLPSEKVGNKQDFKEIMTYLDLPNKEKTKADWAVLTTAKDTVQVERRRFIPKKVPDVTGMGLKDALFLLGNEGLKVKTKGSGTIYRQSLIPGTATKGQTIYLDLK